MQLTFFYLYFFIVILAALVIVVLFLRYRLKHRGMIARSLNLVLLAVRFPPQPPQDLTLQQVREKIALMEQCYSQLHSLSESGLKGIFYGRPAFALELTIPSVGEEISFYIALPRRFAAGMAKLVQGIFPDAHVEESRDYNIFNPEGETAGAQVILKENQYYPVRTYQRLEGDPLRSITNVFTKLAREGEGAAIQIVARQAPSAWHTTLEERARELAGGKRTSEDKVLRVAQEVVGVGEQAREQEERERREVRRLTPREEEMVKELSAKASKALFETNIRLVASAPTKARALTILDGLGAAFAQFSGPYSNSFEMRPVEGRALKNLVFNFSFRSFINRKPSILATDELTSIFHFPNVPLGTPKIKDIKAREAPSPAHLPQEGLLMGYNVFRGESAEVHLLDEDRRRHLYIIGQTGTGKSVYLKNMIIQDIEAGKGVCVIDPHGDMVEDILGFVPRERNQDVVYFNPGDVERPMGLNMLEYDPMFPEQKTFIVNELLSIFDKLYNMSIAGGPMFEQYFRNATLLVMDDPASGNTLLEIERVLTDKEFRDHKLSRSKNIVVKNFWREIAEKAGGEASLKDMVPYIASKFDNFIANEIMRPIIAQQKSAFNFREVMDNRKILLVNLSKGRLGELNSSLIGLIIVGKLLMAALSRTSVAEERREDFYLYIDEFQNVTTDSIATILSEARKYRLDLTITHQFIGQLKDEIKKAVFGNVGSMVSFRIGSDDAEFMAKQYKPTFTEQDLLNIDNFNCYVKLLINGATSIPFSMKTYPPRRGNKDTAEVMREISRVKYGRPREEVENEIVANHEKPLS